MAVAIDNRPGLFTIPGFGAEWRAGRLVRLVGLRRHRARCVAQRARARTHREGHFIRSSLRVQRDGVRSRLAAQPRRAERQAPRDGDDPKGAALPSLEVADPADRWRQRSSADDPAARHQALGSRSSEPLSGLSRVSRRRRQDTFFSSSETFGLREITIRNRHLLINGQRVRLSGIVRRITRISPWEGLAGVLLRYDALRLEAEEVDHLLHLSEPRRLATGIGHRGRALLPALQRQWRRPQPRLARHRLLLRRYSGVSEPGPAPSPFYGDVRRPVTSPPATTSTASPSPTRSPTPCFRMGVTPSPRTCASATRLSPSTRRLRRRAPGRRSFSPTMSPGRRAALH